MESHNFRKETLNIKVTMNNFKKSLTIAALVIIIIAWFIGYNYENSNFQSSITNAVKDVDSLTQFSTNTFNAYSNNSFVGYLVSSESNGYSGPLILATLIDTNGTINSNYVVNHKETYSFYKKVIDKNYLFFFDGMKINEPLNFDQDVDVVSGATITSKCIFDAVDYNRVKASSEIFNIEVSPSNPKSFQFGLREVLLLLTVAFGFFAFFTQLARF